MRKLKIENVASLPPLSISLYDTMNEVPRRQLIHAMKVLNTPLNYILPEKAENLFWKRLQIFKALYEVDDYYLNLMQESLLEEDPENGTHIYYEYLKTLVETGTAFLFKIDPSQEKEEETDELFAPTTPEVPETEKGIQLAHTLTLCPYPYIKIKDATDKIIKWYAPYSSEPNMPFLNVSLYELTRVFTLFQRYVNDPSVQNRATLVATMYRPSKPNTNENIESNYEGDIRQSLSKFEFNIPHRSKMLIEQYADSEKEDALSLIVFWVSCSIFAISERFGSLFSGSSEGKSADWVDFIMELSGGDITKKTAILEDKAYDTLEWANREVVNRPNRKSSTI